MCMRTIKGSAPTYALRQQRLRLAARRAVTGLAGLAAAQRRIRQWLESGRPVRGEHDEAYGMYLAGLDRAESSLLGAAATTTDVGAIGGSAEVMVKRSDHSLGPIELTARASTM